jgi:hypothetical protein
MRTESEIKQKGIEVLLKELGDVDTERFIELLSRDSFDYTEWQKNLWDEQSVSEISQAAAKWTQRERHKK